MLKLEDKALKFLNELKKFGLEKEFGYDNETGDVNEYILDDLWTAMKNAGIDGDVDYGASKLVVINPEQYVLKISFNGTYMYSWDEEYEEWSDDYYFEPFIKDDYCKIEYENYVAAEKEGLAFLFAKIAPIGEVDNKTIYIQDYINFSIPARPSDESKSIADSLITSEKNNPGQRRIKCTEWLANVVEWYGEDVANRLVDFISERDINDLHLGNCGYALNGAPKLADYSGWFD